MKQETIRIMLAEMVRLASRVTALEKADAANRAVIENLRKRLYEAPEATAAPPAPRRQKIAEIVQETAYLHGFMPADLVGQCRKADVCRARQAAMSAAHDAGYSLKQIGNALGGRDHTTILHGIKAHRTRVAA